MNSEQAVTISILVILCLVYSYILFSPTQPHLSERPLNFVLQPDTKESFERFMNESLSEYSYSSYSYKSMVDDYNYTSTKSYRDWGTGEGKHDDFYYDKKSGEQSSYIDDWQNEKRGSKNVTITPSTEFYCQSGWLTIRSDLNYKYLWLHADENMWMGATATMETPLHRKAFYVAPATDCSDGGWVSLKAGDSPHYVRMVSPSEGSHLEEWVVKMDTDNIDIVRNDTSYHFLLEKEGYILNRGAMAFVNVLPEAEYSVRGHSGSWDRSRPAGREYGAMMKLTFINATFVEEAIQKSVQEQKDADDQDKELLEKIAKFPTSTEKRVISFGLYGAKEKYTLGAIKNAKLAQTYFPGWVCRFYVTSDVPPDVVDRLKELGSEILSIPSGMGYSSGMFWRFLVASDESVDRYIVRDVDSRLNARDRVAVEEWIHSGKPVHILRDHVNHCIVMNGGMWGGVKSAVPDMKSLVDSWSSRDQYMADLHFLEKSVWPIVKENHIAHDSYCCDRFPNTRPFPTQRSTTYQHVGQVFDKADNPRYNDIDGFIRGVPIPVSCRKKSEWIYG